MLSEHCGGLFGRCGVDVDGDDDDNDDDDDVEEDDGRRIDVDDHR